MLPVLALLFLVIPVAEIWVLIQVGHAIGGLTTVAVLLAGALLGAWLVRREGARAWGRFRAAAASGRLPAAEAADGALVLVGGALLVTPGFLTDAVGLLCVLPVTRPLVRRLMVAAVARRAAARASAAVGLDQGRRRQGTGRQPAHAAPMAHDVIDGEVVRERS